VALLKFFNLEPIKLLQEGHTLSFTDQQAQPIQYAAVFLIVIDGI
jgi:hypothetical protein